MIITHMNWIYAIDVHAYDPGYPGKATGPADSCYPGEDPEIDFSVLCVTSQDDRGDYADLLMVDDLNKKIIEKLLESEE